MSIDKILLMRDQEADQSRKLYRQLAPGIFLSQASAEPCIQHTTGCLDSGAGFAIRCSYGWATWCSFRRSAKPRYQSLCDKFGTSYAPLERYCIFALVRWMARAFIPGLLCTSESRRTSSGKMIKFESLSDHMTNQSELKIVSY